MNNMPQTGCDTLEGIIRAAGARLKCSQLLFGLSWWVATCSGLWLALFFLDNAVNLPAGLRLPLALGALVFSGLAFASKPKHSL